MQFDLWQRRVGWIGMVGVVLFCGAVAQTRFAAADDGDDPSAPVPQQNFNFVLDDQPAPASGENQEPRANNWRMRWIAPIDGQNQRPWEIVQQWAGGGETGKYWIGVECHEAQPELRAQLSLGEDQGLVVARVLKDSPADKAGILTHDVIVSAGDKNLDHVPDLQKAVEAADGKELTLKILRKGKENVLHLSPAERPQDRVQLLARPGGMGIVVPGMNFNMAHVQLPDNVSVSINREGSKPANIVVKRGDEKWDVTDQELDKLPADLRPMVERMLGVGPMTINWVMRNPAAPGNLQMPQVQVPQIQIQPIQPPQPRMQPPEAGAMPGRRAVNPPAGDGSADIARRLEELDRRLQMLQNEIRGMRDGGPRDGGPRDGGPRDGGPRDGERRGPPQPGEPGRQPPRDNPPAPGTPPRPAPGSAGA